MEDLVGRPVRGSVDQPVQVPVNQPVQGTVNQPVQGRVDQSVEGLVDQPWGFCGIGLIGWLSSEPLGRAYRNLVRYNGSRFPGSSHRISIRLAPGARLLDQPMEDLADRPVEGSVDQPVEGLAVGIARCTRPPVGFCGSGLIGWLSSEPLGELIETW